MIDSTMVKLPAQDWERILQLGIDSHTKELQDELTRSLENIRRLEAKYRMTFERLQKVGLPENAGLEEHEDYVEWSSWEGYRLELESKLKNLRALDQVSNGG